MMNTDFCLCYGIILTEEEVDKWGDENPELYDSLQDDDLLWIINAYNGDGSWFLGETIKTFNEYCKKEIYSLEEINKLKYPTDSIDYSVFNQKPKKFIIMRTS